MQILLSGQCEAPIQGDDGTRTSQKTSGRPSLLAGGLGKAAETTAVRLRHLFHANARDRQLNHGRQRFTRKAQHVSLADKLATPPVRATGGRSVLDDWLDNLDTTDRDAALSAIRNPAWRHVDLQAALEAEGAPKVADTTFGVWRKKRARA